MRVFHQNESCPRVMKEEESKNAALILMKYSYFDRTLLYYVDRAGQMDSTMWGKSKIGRK